MSVSTASSISETSSVVRRIRPIAMTKDGRPRERPVKVQLVNPPILKLFQETTESDLERWLTDMRSRVTSFPSSDEQTKITFVVLHTAEDFFHAIKERLPSRAVDKTEPYKSALDILDDIELHFKERTCLDFEPSADA